VVAIDLDPKVRERDRIQSRELTEQCQNGEEAQVVKVGEHMFKDAKDKLVQTLKENRDTFAWTTADMLEADPRIACHRLAVYKDARPVAKEKREK